jgi:hypothetical protein
MSFATGAAFPPSRWLSWAWPASPAAKNLGRQWIGIDISPTACLVLMRCLQLARTGEHVFGGRRNMLMGKAPMSTDRSTPVLLASAGD